MCLSGRLSMQNLDMSLFMESRDESSFQLDGARNCTDNVNLQLPVTIHTMPAYLDCCLVLLLERVLAVQRLDYGTIYIWKSTVKTSHGALEEMQRKDGKFKMQTGRMNTTDSAAFALEHCLVCILRTNNKNVRVFSKKVFERCKGLTNVALSNPTKYQNLQLPFRNRAKYRRKGRPPALINNTYCFECFLVLFLESALTVSDAKV
jgi:hypothetical protein